jgi:tRNA A37 threonylcarbamoyladenosine dehydratase
MRVGAAGLERLAAARVAVVGLGAVGSFAVEALARSGIGNLRLVDFDDIKPSNLNRQLYALTSTLGRYKVDVALERVRDINPAIHVEGMRRFFDSSSADEVLDGIDHVVDAIDSLSPKVTLIAACVNRGIPVVSAMGAADRTDPTRLRVTDLFESGGCPLARHVRKRLRRQGIEGGPMAVWSDEATAVVSHCDEVPPDAPPEEEALRRGRDRRPLPSMAPMPAIFGLAAANHVILAILGDAIRQRQ